MYFDSKTDLGYACTNEHLGAIVSGLDIQPSDRVLAVAGSGDQALAILEKAGFVKAVDTKQVQIDFLKKRVEAISKGDYDSAFNVEFFGRYDGCICGAKRNIDVARSMLKRRNSYFLESNRLNQIRNNLANLEISEPDSIQKVAQSDGGFTKIYLSNILGYCGNGASSIAVALRDFASKLPEGGLIQVSNHDSLRKFWCVHAIEDPDKDRGTEVIYSLIEKGINFLPPGLRLDATLTAKAREFENGIWEPAVYRKISLN
jgi:hypothetical protein